MRVPEHSRRGACSRELGDEMSKADCCCTVGRGWGETVGVCEVCPRNGTREHVDSEYHYTDVNISGEFEDLCPGGPGFSPDAETVILEGNLLLKENTKYQILLQTLTSVKQYPTYVKEENAGTLSEATCVCVPEDMCWTLIHKHASVSKHL